MLIKVLLKLHTPLRNDDTEKWLFVFNCKETGLSWKKMPGTAYIPSHKPKKDRPILLLCVNASGNLKIKLLLVYCSSEHKKYEHNIEHKKYEVIKNRLGSCGNLT